MDGHTREGEAPGDWLVLRVLKEDALGRVELLEGRGRWLVRRVACGGRLPLSRVVALQLAERERRALHQCAGLAGVPGWVEDPRAAGAASLSGSVPPAREVLLRTYLEGAPLHKAERLPEDFFERLEELVQSLHARGVCHNDLHKEQNIVVDAAGYPALIDFQLASCHRAGDRRFAARAHDDVRHVHKHRRRYARLGAPPLALAASLARPRPPRSPVAAAWRRWVKPLYNLLTRRILRRRDGEERRPSSGPWPTWTPPVGPRR